MERLGIISNEKFIQMKKNFFCDNIDMKSIPEGLVKVLKFKFLQENQKFQKLSQN